MRRQFVFCEAGPIFSLSFFLPFFLSHFKYFWDELHASKLQKDWACLCPHSIFSKIINVIPQFACAGTEGRWRYRSKPFPTSAPEGVGGQHHAPAAIPPGKAWYPLYRRLGKPQGRSVRLRKISPPSRFDPRTVQAVASRYTDCAIPAAILQFFFTFFSDWTIETMLPYRTRCHQKLSREFLVSVGLLLGWSMSIEHVWMTVMAHVSLLRFIL